MKQALLIMCTIATLFLVSMTAYAEMEPVMPNTFGTYQLIGIRQERITHTQADFLSSINAKTAQESVAAVDTPFQKMGDGVINTVTAWADIPRSILEVTNQKDSILMGMTFGLGEGVASGLKRGVAGVYQVTTCTISPYDRPLVAPVYKVDHPQKDGLKISLFKW